MGTLDKVDGLASGRFVVNSTSLAVFSHRDSKLVAVAEGHLGWGRLPAVLAILLLQVPHLLHIGFIYLEVSE